MRIQLNIFQVRQAKQSGKEETLKSEELQTLKKKYTRVLKKYHEVTQELAAQKRKEERGLFTSYFGRQTDDSLSLSP
jgi:flagellar motility protein MotE (MotC chaperone)